MPDTVLGFPISLLVNAAIGGLLIGAAAIFLLGMLGRITGISGITWQALRALSSGTFDHWRWAFIGGLVLGPVIVHQFLNYSIPSPNPSGLTLAAIAGLLTGFGTKLGSGCTSGHGICGIGRLSPRSLAATLCFMLTAIATTTIMRHVL
ncbi:YeeE/YedE family protein [bacterium]|nr:YeeE/YedE family protein [bacterium]